MSRVPELVWAGVFVGLAIGAVVGVVAWPWVFGVAGVVTVVLAGIESRRACYHGVGWEWVNPGLREWWAKRQGSDPWAFVVGEGVRGVEDGVCPPQSDTARLYCWGVELMR